MHDNHALVEQRIRRELDERLRPAVHAERVLFAITAWSVPGEPVPYEEAMAAAYEPFAARRRVGPAVGHDLVPVHGHGAGGLGGRRGRGRDRPRLPVRRRRLPGRGPGLDRRRPPAGRPSPPDRGAPPGREGRRAGGGRARGGGQPVVPLVPALTDGLARHRTARTALPPPPGRPGRPRPHRVRARPRRRGPGRDHARPPAGRPPPGPPAADAGAGLRRARPRRRQRHRGAPREVLAPALALPARASAHTTVAVGHAHIDTAWLWPLRETVRKCTRTFASAVRLMDDEPDYRFVCSQAAQQEWMRVRHPGLFARMQEKARRRAVDPGRRHVGRGRHEPAERRVDRAPARPRSAVLRGALRSALPRGLDPGRLRLPRLAPADLRAPAAAPASSRRSCRGTRRTASPTARSGGRASTGRRC